MKGYNGHRVLLVEDEPDSVANLRLLLELKGHSVDIAENGLRALQILQKREQPNIVLVDLMMPMMTGWELCAELRKQERLSDLPIVILSRMVGTRHIEIPNAVAQLSKPVDLQKLSSLIEEHCASTSTNAQHIPRTTSTIRPDQRLTRRRDLSRLSTPIGFRRRGWYEKDS